MKLNKVIRSFIEMYGLDATKPLLPNAKMLIDDIIAIAPEKTKLINELFNDIILYENRVIEAKKNKLPNGNYSVDLKVSLKKIKAKPNGEEQFVSFQEEIPVGLRDKKGSLIYYKKHLLKDGEANLKLTVDKEPFKVGVDPLNTFIDKSAKDNEIKL